MRRCKFMGMHWPIVLSLVAIAAGNASSARAALVNGNFEAPDLSSNPTYVVLDTEPWGWREAEDDGPDSSTGIIRAMHKGEVLRPIGPNNYNVGFLQLANERATTAALWQVVTETLQANTEYLVTFSVGNRKIAYNASRDPDTIFRAYFTLGDTGPALPPAAGSTSVAKALGQGELAEANNLDVIEDGTWHTNQTISFSTVGMTAEQLAQGLNLVFQLDRGAGADSTFLSKQVSEVFLDNVTLTAVDINPVPEPSTWTLLGIGSLGLLWARKRGRRAVNAGSAAA